MNIDKDTMTAIGVIFTAGVSCVNLIYTRKQNKNKGFIETVTASRIKWISDVRSEVADYIEAIPKYDYYFLYKLDNLKVIELTDTIYKNCNLELLKKINSKIKLLLNGKGTDDEEIMKKIDEIFNNVFQIKVLLQVYTSIEKEDRKKLSETLNEETCDILLQQIPNDILERLGTDSNKNEMVFNLFNTYNNRVNFNFLNRTIEIIINDKVSILSSDLVKQSQDYLKKEWDRVKEESKSGDLLEKKKSVFMLYWKYILIIIIMFILIGIVIA